MCLFKLVFSLDKCPGVELPDDMAVVFLIFEDPPCCFPWWLHQFTFPLTVCRGSLFSTSSPTLTVSCLFDDGDSEKCVVLFHCGFYLHLSCGY